MWIPGAVHRYPVYGAFGQEAPLCCSSNTHCTIFAIILGWRYGLMNFKARHAGLCRAYRAEAPMNIFLSFRCRLLAPHRSRVFMRTPSPHCDASALMKMPIQNTITFWTRRLSIYQCCCDWVCSRRFIGGYWRGVTCWFAVVLKTHSGR